MNSPIKISSPFLGKSDYSTPQPQILIDGEGHWRQLRAAAFQLASKIEERSGAFKWSVVVGQAVCIGRGISRVKLSIELAYDTDAEATAAMNVLCSVVQPERIQVAAVPAHRLPARKEASHG